MRAREIPQVDVITMWLDPPLRHMGGDRWCRRAL